MNGRTHESGSSDEPCSTDDENDGADGLVGDEPPSGQGDRSTEAGGKVDENDGEDHEERDCKSGNESFDWKIKSSQSRFKEIGEKRGEGRRTDS